jgi:hypothetical protein
MFYRKPTQHLIVFVVKKRNQKSVRGERKGSVLFLTPNQLLWWLMCVSTKLLVDPHIKAHSSSFLAIQSVDIGKCLGLVWRFETKEQ